MCFILSWFGVHQSILRSWGDISVLLVLWQGCWDFLEFNQANRGSLCVWLGKRNCSACNAGESGLISWRGGSLMDFLELASSGQRIEASASACLSNEYSGLVSFRIHWFDLLEVHGTLKSLFQHPSSKASVLWHSAFFMVQLSNLYKSAGKAIALTMWTWVRPVMPLLLNMQLSLS